MNGTVYIEKDGKIVQIAIETIYRLFCLVTVQCVSTLSCVRKLDKLT